MLPKTSPEIGGMGHSVKRKEDLRFILGKGTYVEDVHLPGMVYGQMVRSPYAHARIKAVRTEAARNFPGVLAVITGQDLEKAGLSWMPTLFHDKQMVLATGKVLFQSQEVAFVVAEDRYTAAPGSRRSTSSARCGRSDSPRGPRREDQSHFSLGGG
jgi:carbon-monoxide dehydrogenase large subunit